MVTKSPITGESAKETVKTIARGMPGVSGVTVVTNSRVFYSTREAAGAPSARHSLRPLKGGREICSKTRANAPRDRETVPMTDAAFTSPRVRGRDERSSLLEVGDEAIAKAPGEGDSPRVSLSSVPLTRSPPDSTRMLRGARDLSPQSGRGEEQCGRLQMKFEMPHRRSASKPIAGTSRSLLAGAGGVGLKGADALG